MINNVKDYNMQIQTHRKTIRMSDNIASAMETVCSNFGVKESEYIRRAVMERLETDLKTSQEQNKNFIFI